MSVNLFLIGGLAGRRAAIFLSLNKDSRFRHSREREVEVGDQRRCPSARRNRRKARIRGRVSAKNKGGYPVHSARKPEQMVPIPIPRSKEAKKAPLARPVALRGAC